MGLDASVIIVNYKTPELVCQCIRSIKENTQHLTFEVIVVDNNSGEDSKILINKTHPDVHWIDAGYNSGFARGNNTGIRAAKGKFCLLINSDTWIERNAILDLLNFYKRKNKEIDLGLLGCRLLDQHKQLLIGTHQKFPSLKPLFKANPLVIGINRLLGNQSEKKKISAEKKTHDLHFKNHEVSVVSGACVFFEREKLIKNNLFLDEDFFLYSEDTEWSYRTSKSGLTNYFCGETEIFHINSASTKHDPNKENQIRISEMLYFYKTLSPILFWIYTTLFRFNYYLDLYLLKRKVQFETMTLVQKKQYAFSKYIRIIRKHYKRRPSSAKDYLKYAE